jgi:hypothetical protein
VRTALLLAQAALSVVLLVGAALFVRSLQRVEKLDLGWQPEGALLVGIDLRGMQLTNAEREALTRRAAA